MLLRNRLAQLESWASPWSQLVRQSAIQTIWMEMGLLQENECVLPENIGLKDPRVTTTIEWVDLLPVREAVCRP